MRIGLVISFLVHAAILAAAIVVLPEPDKFDVAHQESIPVDIIEITDKSERRATKKDALPVPEQKVAPNKQEKLDKPEPKPVVEPDPEPVVKQPQPEPEPEPQITQPEPPKPDPVKDLIEKTETLPEPKPEPKPEPEEKQADKKPPVPIPRAKPKVPRQFVEQQKKKKKKKHKFNPDQLTALLNKIDEKPANRPPPSDEDGNPAPGDIDSPVGNDLRMSASEVDWLRQRIEQCWNPPVGVREAEKLIVRIRFEMDLDGNVIGAPRVLNSSANPLFPVAADSALRAVLRCQPYAGLPQEKYDLWRDVTLNFDPSKMLAVN